MSLNVYCHLKIEDSCKNGAFTTISPFKRKQTLTMNFQVQQITQKKKVYNILGNHGMQSRMVICVYLFVYVYVYVYVHVYAEAAGGAINAISVIATFYQDLKI